MNWTLTSPKTRPHCCPSWHPQRRVEGEGAAPICGGRSDGWSGGSGETNCAEIPQAGGERENIKGYLICAQAGGERENIKGYLICAQAGDTCATIILRDKQGLLLLCYIYYILRNPLYQGHH